MKKFKFNWFQSVISLIAFLIILFVWIFIVGISSKQPGAFFNKGHNAVWIGHEWVAERSDDSEIIELVKNLEKNQIDTVFVHVGPINKDGSIDPETYRYSVDFIEKVKKFNKKIEYQAWLGQIRGKIDLSDESVRHNISKLCMILGHFVGFDGIHFDIEPVWDKDEDFIKLLAECREILKDGKKISVAMAEMIPKSFLWFTEKIFKFENFNSEINYKNVAKYADQIVVMVYDTGVDEDWFYRWLVREQTIRVTDLLDDKEVFIAIPAYDEPKEGFNPKVENVENGLRGIIHGMNDLRSNEKSFAGVAIYPYWGIDEKEWQIYQDLWIK